MTIPAIHELDPLEQLKALRDDDPLEQLKATKRRAVAPSVAADATRALPRDRDHPSGDYEAAAPAVLGSVASLLRKVPGGEAMQSGARALFRGQSYRDARNDIRDTEDSSPLKVPAEVAGGTLAALAIPGGAARSGFLYGASDALGSSDPDADLKSRVDNAGLQGATYGGLGAIGQAAGAVKALPPGTFKTVGKAVLPHNFQRGAKAFQAIRDAATAVPEVAEASAPQTEGFVGNSMDNVLEAVKAREAPSSKVLDLVKSAPRHRTAAQFESFAQQMGKEAPQPATFDGQLHSVLKKARSMNPADEIGNQWGDAEEAMGLAPHQQPDLEDLLRRSLQLAPRHPPR